MSTNVFTDTLTNLGRPVVALARDARGQLRLFRDTVLAIFKGRIAWREFFLQCLYIGNRSVPFVIITLGVLGFITVYQIGAQLKQILPDYSMVGAAMIQQMCREFAPTITGLMVATRVGTGIAAEIGSMVVTEQVDALRMCNADPVEYLIVPRTLASGLMLIVLTVVGVIAATSAGMVMARIGYDVPYATFFSFELTQPKDVFVGLAKAISYGIAIPVIAGHAGLTATGGSAGVGWATTRAVVNTSFAVIVIDFVISGAAYIFKL